MGRGRGGAGRTPAARPASLVTFCEEAARRDKLQIYFLPDRGVASIGELWTQADRAGSALLSRFKSQAVVASVLFPSPAGVLAVLTAIAAGVTLVSLPAAPRARELGDYVQLLRRICEQANVDVLLVGEDDTSCLSELGLPVMSVSRHSSARRRGGGDGQRFELVQFTSGSVTTPKGVRLPDDYLVANVRAMLVSLAPREREVITSWLPFSHDMGLIGVLFTSLIGAGADDREVDLILMTPETFIWRPEVWLNACSRFGATMSAAPDFGLRRATSAVARCDALDLRHMRAIITGAEPVRASTLSGFAETFAPAGLRSTALSPAYGMAEAGLAVTMVRPDEHWNLRRQDMEGQAPRVVVGCGRPLTGYGVRVHPGPHGVGEIVVYGPSLASEYLDGSSVADADGCWLTGDIGFLDGDELYVVGRADDMVVVRGRNIHVIDVGEALAGVQAVRHDRVVVAADEELGFVVAAEVRRKNLGTAPTLAAARRAIMARVGVSPDLLALLPPGALPVTTSGKPRRQSALLGLASGEIEPLVAAGIPAGQRRPPLDSDH
jgi:acyl-CoA synthetase (AMP-forming)/AMP-acid ligase II